MKYKTLNLYHEEILPWKEYIPENANKLILGTFPTKKQNRDFEFFYPNKNNKFWKVLARIANKKLSNFEINEEGKLLAIKERKEILDILNLAITDMGARVLRQNNSSLDNNLFPLEFTDVFSIIQNHPKIKTIILTSSSNKGNSALSWFASYCLINKVNFQLNQKNKNFPLTTEIILEGNIIKVVVVYSTSGLAGKSEDFLVDLYKKVIIS